MKNFKLNEFDNEALGFDFEELNSVAELAKANIAAATTAGQVKTEICKVWNKVRKFVIWAENIPVAGKYFTILADLLDTLCG